MPTGPKATYSISAAPRVSIASQRLQRMQQSLRFATQLERAGAEYFRANPVATARLHRISGYDPRYVAHEYFNPTWSLFYHADIRPPAGAGRAGLRRSGRGDGELRSADAEAGDCRAARRYRRTGCPGWRRSGGGKRTKIDPSPNTREHFFGQRPAALQLRR